jgi:hypothetical protein
MEKRISTSILSVTASPLFELARDVESSLHKTLPLVCQFNQPQICALELIPSIDDLNLAFFTKPMLECMEFAAYFFIQVNFIRQLL